MHQRNSKEAIPLAIALHLCQRWQIKIVDELRIDFLPEKESTDNCDQA
jgi:hypothetical protein